MNFEGAVSPGYWGLTNVKIAFGCDHFLVYESNSCSKCLQGYHSRMENGKIVGCLICPTSCRACTSQTKCSSCVDGFSLVNNTCIASEHFISLTKKVPSTFFHCNELDLRMSSYESSSA